MRKGRFRNVKTPKRRVATATVSVLFRAHVRQIRNNLKSCIDTKSKERRALARVIRYGIAAGKFERDLNIKLRHIRENLKNKAAENGLFFKGNVSAFVSAHEKLVHAELFLWFKDKIKTWLADDSDDRSEDAAEQVANDICYDLRQTSHWSTVGAGSHAAIPLHRHGFPYWVADPGSGRPKLGGDVSLFPARAGMELESGEYVFITLRCTAGLSPRFADSCGHHYWRPGGTTHPRDGCPSGLSGFQEAVIDRISIANISSPIVLFVPGA